MSDYAYPYDPTGTNPLCLVVDEQHALADYPNKWNCVIPQFAPFYRKDLTVRHVETDRVLHEGIDYYLGHHYNAASVENKMAIFGSVMINDKTLSGTLEFTKYRTLGGRYNMPKRVIETHLNQDDLADPRNLDWEDVIRYEMAVPAVDAPKDRDEAIAQDPITGGLDRIRQALERLNAAKETGYDDIISRLTELGDKIHDHNIARHEHQRGRHKVTHAQLGALQKDARAVDALKAYGYTLAELVTLVNLLGENAEDTADLFRLIGDSLEGSLRFDGDNAYIQNETGTSIINLSSGDMEILSTGDVTIRADDDANNDGITAELRSGDNLLTLHSYVGDCTPAVIHNADTTFTERPHITARQIAPTKNFATANGRFFAYKRIYFPGGDVTFGIVSDNSYQLHIDGVSVLSGTAYPTTVRNAINVTEGYHWVSVLCMNNAGPSFTAFSFETSGTVYSVSDATWWVRDVSVLVTADYVTKYPTKVDDSAVFNGFYLIHVGNIVDFLPPPDYVDTILNVDTTPTVFLKGRGISGSPLTGYVFYPIATETSRGVYKLNHSIFSSSKKEASSINAISKLQDLVETKVDNTFEINGYRLNRNITITPSDLGLGKVDNTEPDEKAVSDAFKAAASGKASMPHSHNPSDFNSPPIADKNTLGLTKLTTTQSSREDVAATPVMLNAAYLEQLQTESELRGKMPSIPFDVMQYGGFGYLPLPVQGNYGGAGIGAYVTVGVVEADGTLVCLRCGADLAGSGVYYWYAEYKSDGTFDKIVSTTIEYRPPFIASDDKVSYVARGSDGVFTLKTALGKWYVVLTRNTMDMSLHVGSEIISSNGMPLGSGALYPFLYKNRICFHYSIFGNEGAYFRHWDVLVSDVDAGNEITPIRKMVSSTAWDGEVFDNELTGYFTKYGQSLEADKVPVIHRLDDNYWNGANNVGHATQNSFIAIKDNKIRVLIYRRSYYSNTSRSTGITLSHSYVFDLDTMVGVSDNPEDFPIRLYSDHWESPNNHFPAEAWPWANPNNVAVPFISKGRMFVTYYYGTMYIPRICEFVSSQGFEIFDYAHAHSATYRVLTSSMFTGAYGSVSHSMAKYIGWLGDNKMFYYQNDGLSVVEEYDPDGQYIETDNKGFGPTTNRYSISGTDRGEMVRVPYCWDIDAAAGFVLSDVYTTTKTKIEGEVAVDPITLPSSVSSSTLASLKTLHPAEGSAEFYQHRLALHAFGDVKSGSLDMFLTYTVIRYADSEHTRKETTTYFHKCTIAVNLSGTMSVTGVTIGDLIMSPKWSTTTTGFGGFDSYGQDVRAVMNDGNILYCLNNSMRVGWVGNGGGHGFRCILSPAGEVLWTSSSNLYSYTTYGNTWEPNLGYFSMSSAASGEAISAHCVGRTLAEIQSSADDYTCYIRSTQVATGWIIYFTEEVRFYVGGVSIILPIQNFDLSTYTDHQNTTFYIYVSSVYDELGNPLGVYEFNKTKLPDTETTMYVGYAKTDDIQITEIKVERATRLGTLYELEQHEHDKRAHNDITNLDKYSFSLGNVENMGMLHTLTLPTFKEIFDTWKRISHLETTENQPANVTELGSWQYNESNDSIICPINSATFVGFVSPGEVGDYVFDTLVGSPGSDNDGVVIILAYRLDDQGKEHTLCATRSRSIEGHMKVSGKFDIWYNYKQSSRKLIATAGGTSNEGNWMGNYSRITAVRDGDQFTVTATKFVKSTNLIDHGTEQLEGAHTFNIIDHSELDIFKSGGSFGYGCISQPYSTFANILRPDEQVGNYYASADAVRILSGKQAEAVVFATGIVAGGASIPIPAGFTAEQCNAVISFNTVSGGGKLTYAQAFLSGMVCTIKARVKGNVLVTNPAGGNARYHLIARKRPEV